MSHGRPPLKDVCKHFEKLHKLMDMDKEHLIKSIQQVQKSKQPLDKMDADKKLARFFIRSNRTGSVHWRFGSVRFVSEPGEPSTHG
uniref:Uncharacterized protein n=1 Tax=Rhizophagus irregularis (strain DAOM 181602 / DAOM 197198 / MUCL 43194) TaxID=747089 RepID=U9T565_RHIID